MTSDDIIRMAQEAGLAHTQPRAGQYDGGWIAGSLADLTDFAALVAAAEREECAALCERFANRMMSAEECADAIRAGSEP
jgi:hypothetical protein